MFRVRNDDVLLLFYVQIYRMNFDVVLIPLPSLFNNGRCCTKGCQQGKAFFRVLEHPENCLKYLFQKRFLECRACKFFFLLLSSNYFPCVFDSKAHMVGIFLEIIYFSSNFILQLKGKFKNLTFAFVRKRTNTN